MNPFCSNCCCVFACARLLRVLGGTQHPSRAMRGAAGLAARCRGLFRRGYHSRAHGGVEAVQGRFAGAAGDGGPGQRIDGCCRRGASGSGVCDD